MKTADSTRDGTGAVIGSSSADHRNSSGYILSGRVPHHVRRAYRQGDEHRRLRPRPGQRLSWATPTATASTASWRAQRTWTAPPPDHGARLLHARSVIAAWDWRDGQFTRRWTFDTNSSTNAGKGYDGQGNHQLSVADVGTRRRRDEIVYGAMAVDDNGHGLWTTRNGHGDAMHVGDLDPSRAGLEVGRRGQLEAVVVDGGPRARARSSGPPARAATTGVASPQTSGPAAQA